MAAPATGTRWGALAAVTAATLVLCSDVTAMATALPTIEKDLSTDLTTAAWVMNAYLIAFGVSIATGGWIADRLGLRRVLIAGLTGFAVFAALGAAAPSVEWLIVARALQGVSAGLIWPAVVAEAFVSAAPRQRVMAVGLILGAAGLGEALGPLLGGLVTDQWSWRWILGCKPLIGGLAILACLFWLPDDHRPGRLSIDYLGIGTLSVSLFALLFALDEVVSDGWGSTVVVGSLVVSAVAMVAFVTVELRQEQPLIPREVLRDPAVRSGALLMFATAPCFFVSLLFVPQVLAKVLGYGPLKTGLAMLPMQLVFTLVAPLCGVIAARVGLKVPHTLGLLALGAAGVAFAGYDGDGYAGLLPAMILYGVGVGLAYPAVTALIMLGLGVDRAALAVGILFTVELVTGGLATAAATTAVGTSSDLVDELAPVYGTVAALAFAGAVVALFVSPGRERTVSAEPSEVSA